MKSKFRFVRLNQSRMYVYCTGAPVQIFLRAKSHLKIVYTLNCGICVVCAGEENNDFVYMWEKEGDENGEAEDDDTNFKL